MLELARGNGSKTLAELKARRSVCARIHLTSKLFQPGIGATGSNSR